MIKSFRHKGLERFFTTGNKSGIQPVQAGKLRLMLTALSVAEKPEDLNVPAWRLHPLKGDREGEWALRVDENWRLVFRFDGQDVELVDYVDYH
ncbi:MAG: type II toxin-antitoxin system RelE/ParE family toxin [Chromatiales bacterium]